MNPAACYLSPLRAAFRPEKLVRPDRMVTPCGTVHRRAPSSFRLSSSNVPLDMLAYAKGTAASQRHLTCPVLCHPPPLRERWRDRLRRPPHACSFEHFACFCRTTRRSHTLIIPHHDTHIDCGPYSCYVQLIWCLPAHFRPGKCRVQLQGQNHPSSVRRATDAFSS